MGPNVTRPSASAVSGGMVAEERGDQGGRHGDDGRSGPDLAAASVAREANGHAGAVERHLLDAGAEPDRVAEVAPSVSGSRPEPPRMLRPRSPVSQTCPNRAAMADWEISPGSAIERFAMAR